MIIGISGGSGSGKTYFARLMQALLGQQSCCLLQQDSYYIDQSRRFDFDGGSVNFDHPESIDFPLLSQHLVELREGRSAKVPVYDYETHCRLERTETLHARSLIVVEGMLILSQPEIRAQLDVKVFIDAPEQVRYSRRLARDACDRGRSSAGVEQQFRTQVKPMHDRFVEPSKTHADRVYSGEGDMLLNGKDLVRYIGLDCTRIR